MAELRTVLAVLVGNFLFELPEGVQREKFIEKEEVWWVTLQAKHGLPLKVTPIMGEYKAEKGSNFFYHELTRLANEAKDKRTAGKPCLKR